MVLNFKSMGYIVFASTPTFPFLPFLESGGLLIYALVL